MRHLKARQGYTSAWTEYARDVNGAVVTNTYAGTETLELVVWKGDDRGAVALSVWSGVTWVSGPAGSFLITLDDSDVATLERGIYTLLVRVIVNGEPKELGAWFLTVEPGASTSDTVPAVYCTFEDMLSVAGPMVQHLMETSDQTGFAEQRAQARWDFDAIIQAHYRPGSEDRPDSLDYFLDGAYRSGYEDTALQAWLDAGRLVLTGPTGKRIVRWNALTACAYVYDRQVGKGPDGNPYAERAARWRQEADAIASTLIVGIDTTTTADGVADISVDLGIADTIRR